jgi:hypothetical protein
MQDQDYMNILNKFNASNENIKESRQISKSILVIFRSIGSPTVLNIYLDCLKELKDEEVRTQALYELSWWNDIDSITEISELIGSPDPGIQKSAAHALVNYRPPASTEILRKLITEQEYLSVLIPALEQGPHNYDRSGECRHDTAFCICLKCGRFVGSNHLLDPDKPCICMVCGRVVNKNHTFDSPTSCRCIKCGHYYHVLENCHCIRCGTVEHSWASMGNSEIGVYMGERCTVCGETKYWERDD